MDTRGIHADVVFWTATSVEGKDFYDNVWPFPPWAFAYVVACTHAYPGERTHIR